MVACAEEERFRRVKHWAGFPSDSIRFCLSNEGINISDINHVAINRNPGANLFKKLIYTIKNRPNLRLVSNRIKNARDWLSIEQKLRNEYPNETFSGNVHHIEHHLSHVSSAHFTSPYEQSIAISIDGLGDFSSAAWAVGTEYDLDIKGRIFFPHSLGIFYQSMTQFLGFHDYGDEYKVMGLAAYGSPKYMNQMQKIVHLANSGTFSLNLKFFRHYKDHIPYEWHGTKPIIKPLFSDYLLELMGPSRKPTDELSQHYKDIASSVQTMYEKAFFHLLNSIYDQYRIDNLALSGGCVMNSVANGKIHNRTPFKNVYIQAAAGDAGGAIGAAYLVWHKILKKTKRFSMGHSFWGPQFSSNKIGVLIESKKIELQALHCTFWRITNENQLCQLTASAIFEGKIVGWFQGRMEWGPRALGNRSILCDPRRPEMQGILNNKIKSRENFRPFAPSILCEQVNRWFETNDEVPFMTHVYPIKKDKRNLIPAVTHVDGTGRLQTVSRKTNPLYYRLIDAFYRLSGVPMVLNTSFNENEPIVCTPEEALDCFLRTQMDMLILENWIITRNIDNA